MVVVRYENHASCIVGSQLGSELVDQASSCSRVGFSCWHLVGFAALGAVNRAGVDHQGALRLACEGTAACGMFLKAACAGSFSIREF